MFPALAHGVEQHLERGGVTEPREDLHGGGVWQEPLTPVHRLVGGRQAAITTQSHRRCVMAQP